MFSPTRFNRTFSSLEGQSLLSVLRLIRTLNVGPVTFFQLMKRFGTAEAALDALPDLSLRGGRRNPLQACAKNKAEKEIAFTEKFGARMVMYGEADYPKLLTTISDPPPVISILGDPHSWQNKDALAVVGARNASANGCTLAKRLSQQAGAHDLLIVSGLARGIDTFAHQGAIEHGTVAVIASGIDTIYPPENKALYKEIAEKGAIISEQPFGQAPFSGSFPGRNRIIAGMSLGTLIVEASPKSGSLITARFAAEQGREVFAVPGSPLDPRSKGANKLIKEGAHIVEGIEDILEQLLPLRRPQVEEVKSGDYMVAETAQDAYATEGARNTILEKLSTSPTPVDQLIEYCALPASAVLSVVLELELAGKIQRLPGNQVMLVAEDEAMALL